MGKYPWELQLGKIHLGSCSLGKSPWELQLGKIPLGSCSLGKYPWEVVVCHLIYIYGPFQACSKQKREEPRGYSGDDYIVGGNDALSNAYPWYVIDIPQSQHINLPEMDDSFGYCPSFLTNFACKTSLAALLMFCRQNWLM